MTKPFSIPEYTQKSFTKKIENELLEYWEQKCTPPCDSHGICDVCSEMNLVGCGAERSFNYLAKHQLAAKRMYEALQRIKMICSCNGNHSLCYQSDCRIAKQATADVEKIYKESGK